MKKNVTIVVTIICVILIGLNMYLLWEMRSQENYTRSLEQENQALSNYVESLRIKIETYESERKEGVEIPKTLQIRELLDSYLKEKDQQQNSSDITISTEELRTDLEDYQLKQRFIPNIVPLTSDYVVSQRFSSKHKALDLAAPLGSEVVAAAAGVVKSVYDDKFFGHVVVIDHLNHYLTFYAHLTKSMHKPGFFVEKGQPIGLVGNTGFSKAPHLHFEVFYRGDNIDPMTIAEYEKK